VEFGAELAFWIFAVIAVVAAIGVVGEKNLFRAALMLVLSFFAVAGIYGSLSADFLAIAQVLVYMGAISVLIIFGVMLTRNIQRGNPFNRAWPWALVVCTALMGLLIFVFQDTSWSTGMDASQAGPVVSEGDPTTSAIAEAIFDKDAGFLLPLEISAMMILAAVVGAIALVKDD